MIAGVRPKLTCDSLLATQAERKKKRNATEPIVVCDCWARAGEKSRECRNLNIYGQEPMISADRPVTGVEIGHKF